MEENESQAKVLDEYRKMDQQEREVSGIEGWARRVEAVTEGFATYTGDLDTNLAQTKQNIHEKVDGVGKAFGDFRSGVRNSMSNVGKSMSDKINGAAQGFSDGIVKTGDVLTAKWKKGVTFVNGKCAELGEAMNGVPGAVARSGSNILQGFSNIGNYGKEKVNEKVVEPFKEATKDNKIVQNGVGIVSGLGQTVSGVGKTVKSIGSLSFEMVKGVGKGAAWCVKPLILTGMKQPEPGHFEEQREADTVARDIASTNMDTVKDSSELTEAMSQTVEAVQDAVEQEQDKSTDIETDFSLALDGSEYAGLSIEDMQNKLIKNVESQGYGIKEPQYSYGSNGLEK